MGSPERLHDWWTRGSILKSKFKPTQSGGAFEKLYNMASNLRNVSEDLEDVVGEWARDDAIQFAQNLGLNYEQKIKDLPEKERQSAPTLVVKELKDGAEVAMYGHQLLYYEFGTGTVGEQSGYEDKRWLNSAHWEYGSGPNVLYEGQYKNRMDLNGEVPAWYKGYIEHHPDKNSVYTWMSPHGISHGIPALAFFYDTKMDYLRQVYDYKRVTGNEPGLKFTYGLGKHNIKFKFKNKLTKGKW